MKIFKFISKWSHFFFFNPEIYRRSMESYSGFFAPFWFLSLSVVLKGNRTALGGRRSKY